jgi:hypothetical protein
MKIQKWKGLVSGASPYALAPGANTVQNNLQIRKPGQLVPRPGLVPLVPAERGVSQTLLGLHRSSYGGSAADTLTAFYVNASPSAGETTGNIQPDSYLLERLAPDSNGNLSPVGLFTTTIAPASRPSFCEDRHGSLYVFFGSGIRPVTYRPNFDSKAVAFGMDAPTVAPAVTPSGDGWFIERVDVLASGTSYYTAPTVTVTGGQPDRNATLRAVVQGGSIVAIDVVDGGSNFKGVPTITLSNEQVGTGFSARGVRTTNAAVYGFNSATAPTVTQSGTPYAAPRTHAFNLDTANPTIAFLQGSTTTFVPASFSPITGVFTAVVPLNTLGPGAGAFAELRFQTTAAAYIPGNVAPATPNGVSGTNETTTVVGSPGPTNVQFKYSRVGWNTFNSTYYENTFSPANSGISTRFTQSHNANRDRFWALGPFPRRHRFGKSQQYEVGYRLDFWGNKIYVWNWGDYYYPDYSHVSYYILTGPETGTGTRSNWTLYAAPVQVDGNGRPFIDVGLLPALKANGSAYVTQPGTVMPSLRFYLAYCPEAWTVANTQPTNPDTWGRRYRPLNGQDRVNTFGGSPVGLHSGNQQDTWTRWWAEGHTLNFPVPRPVVDFRQGPSDDTYGVTSTSLQVLGQGALLEQGTKFAIRFYQFNAVDYRLNPRAQDFTWLQGIGANRRYLNRTDQEWLEASRGTFSTVFTDFYLEANAIDTSPAGQSLIRPGALITSPPPKVTISGQGWTNSNQTANVRLRHRPDTGDPDGQNALASFQDGQFISFATTLLAPTVTQAKIGSVTILSGGQNYFREPTILYSGGGGYGLRLGATVANGAVTSVAVLDGGDGFVSDTLLYTDVKPAELFPVLRGTMRGQYRCAYRFADYRQTVVQTTTLTTSSPLSGKVVELGNATGVKPGMVITGSPAVRHLCKIVSLQGTTATLSHEPLAAATNSPCVIRDMERPITYSDFSPIQDVDASASGSGRAATLQWALPGVSAPSRADHVEFFRTSSDQSLVFYRLEIYGTAEGGVITAPSLSDGLSDEELFDIDRPAYAALPVVLPNGNVNAFRFGVPRSDMAVAVAWQDRLWYGVSTSGEDVNTVFFSEFDEFESCPDVNELPIQANLRTTDFLTAIIPFGSVLMAMQNSHAYTISYNTDPAIDAAVTLAAHRGALSQQCWDFYDEILYIADERGVYSMDRSGNVQSLSEAIRDFFDEEGLDFAQRKNFYLKVDHATGILRLFAVKKGSGATYPHFSLCYHIRNETWWTESWPTSLTAAAEYRSSGKPDRPVYGAIDGNIFFMDGLIDIANGDIVSVSVTNGGSGYADPPAVTAAGAGGAEFQAVVRDGQVTDILILYGGWGYGTLTPNPNDPSDAVFNPNVTLTIAPPPSGTQATATAQARAPGVGLDANGDPIPPRVTVPWRVRTGPMELIHDGNARGGDAEIPRSITVTYRPTPRTNTLNLREYYNNSPSPRANVMRRDRGTGFVHDTTGARTTLDMSATRTSLGLATGLATAQFAGRSLADLSSADRHLAVELSCDSQPDNGAASIATEPLIYSLEVSGVTDGGE